MTEKAISLNQTFIIFASFGSELVGTLLKKSLNQLALYRKKPEILTIRYIKLFRSKFWLQKKIFNLLASFKYKWHIKTEIMDSRPILDMGRIESPLLKIVDTVISFE